MQGHNPQILRTLIVNLAKNIILLLPGAIKIHNLIFDSRFGPPSENHKISWNDRRVAQIREILSAYLKEWGDIDWLKNKVVVEIGSGDDISLPYSFTLLGASRAYATDVPTIDNITISNSLRDKVTSTIEEVITQKVSIEPNTAENLIVRKSHLGAEALTETFPPESVDLIVSTSTLEHVGAPELVASQMHRILRRGGRMIHAIAMGNHCCGSGEQDRLAHLCYSDWIWNFMFSHRVGHNRFRWFEWERILVKAGFNITGYSLSIISPSELAQYRPYLATCFGKMSDEQLGPNYAVVNCVKFN